MKSASNTAALVAAQENAAANGPEWVLASKYEEMTGVTRETVKQRKKNGTWKIGQQVAVVSRRLYVNIKAADKWISDQNSKHHLA
ncbi:excisionase [Delftia sp. WSY_14]|uniref:excisionase n=1 Tax=unclassified Delftia TaxID=2613839 RepID=UPI003709D069